jgi:tetratricopeptide (TPR) repeat protein
MISWVAIDRITERRAASDAKYRKKVAGRPLRSDAKRLTDEELLTKLGSFGIDLDRSLLGQLCDKALSAEEVARPLLEQCTFRNKRDELEADWVWICLAALWQRWFPDKPCFEVLDDKMQAGYDAMTSGGVVAACRIWLDAWADVLRILDKAGFQSISDFDKRFRGTQSLFNWIQDLEGELWNAGLKDKQFLAARIALCEEGLKRFEATDDELMTENRRRELAESYFELGETDKAEALYREWLKTDPQWGWGWIGWSDCYQFTRSELRDLKRAEQLLLEGLAVAEVRDFKDISERLANLYEDQGRVDEANAIRQLTKMDSAAIRHSLEVGPGENVLRQKTTFTFGDEGLPLSELPTLKNLVRAPSSKITGASRKVGRNEPCPCGSGKKFKKCCARN